MRISPKIALASAAFVLALGNAALAHFAGSGPREAAIPTTARAPEEVSPFALAKMLAEAPPDLVVITLDEPRHPLRGAVPLALFGGTDEALVERAPRARRIVLAGGDVVRTDRVARRLLAAGRDVIVLGDPANQGLATGSLGSGLEAWDKAMDADPAPPVAGAPAAAWQTHARLVALRRAFGDAAPALAPVIVPSGPAVVGPPGAPKKREGC